MKNSAAVHEFRGLIHVYHWEEEAKEREKITTQYKNDIRKLKTQGYSKARSKKYVTGELNVDYIQVENPNGIIEYWRMPKNKKKWLKKLRNVLIKYKKHGIN